MTHIRIERRRAAWAPSRSTGRSASTRSTSRRRRTSARPALQFARDDDRSASWCCAAAAACSAAARTSSTSAAAASGDLGYLHPRPASASRLRRGLQADPRVHPQHDLGDQAAPRSRSSPRWTASPPPAASGWPWPAISCSPPTAPPSSGPTRKTGLTGAESSTFLLPRLIGLRRVDGAAVAQSATRRAADAPWRSGLITAVLPGRRVRRRGARASREQPRGRPDARPAASPRSC